nr:MAG TPA: hypothetical protein [Caudoviricetes sp.]
MIITDYNTALTKRLELDILVNLIYKEVNRNG